LNDRVVNGRAFVYRDVATSLLPAVGGHVTTLASLLSARRDAIIEAWVGEMREKPKCAHLDRGDLVNSIPEYLDSVAALAGHDQATEERPEEISRTHARLRLRQGFRIEEAVSEYVLLTRAIIDEWARFSPGVPSALPELHALLRQIDIAISTAAATFNESVFAEEMEEKKYLSMLQNVATAALDEAPLKERLSQLLQVIVDGMGAAFAEALLYDPATQKLNHSTSVGVARAAGEFHTYSTALATSTFFSSVAAAPGAVYLEDVAAGGHEVSDSLRRSNVRSFLGLRLVARRQLVGVLGIGLLEVRRFRPSEVRRLEAFAERMAMLLDNARIYDKWLADLKDLNSERQLREVFVSTLAHDLRGPLSAAKMGAQQLLRFPADPDAQHKLATRIDGAIDRTDRMIRDLLDANRVRSGMRLPLHLKETDLGSVAKLVVEEVNAAHGHRAVLHSDESVRGIWDADQLRRALWNLVVNGIKYGSSNALVSVSVRRETGVAEVRVHNEGTPIPKEEQSTLFDPFRRAKLAQQGEQKGWGLGLTLVRASIQAHGGEVSVESAPGIGTTFTLKLPWDARRFQAQP
jgi:signal transduction histidine kinase